MESRSHQRDTDEDLARLLQRGNRDALDVLVERHYDALMGYLFRLLHGDRELAEDIAQDSFLRVIRGIGGYTYPRPFKPWFYAIATNLARDHYRGAETRRITTLPQTGELNPALAVDPSTGSGEEGLIAVDEGRAVVAALASLPDHQREVMILYFYQDMPLQAIADTLAIPLGTVKSRLSIGVVRLRERMAQDERSARERS